MIYRITSIFLLLFMLLLFGGCTDLPDVSVSPNMSDISPAASPTASPTATLRTSPTLPPTPTPTPLPTGEPAATVTLTLPAATVTGKPTVSPTDTVAALDSVVSGAPAVSCVLKTVASGTVVHNGGTASEPVVIDASNTSDGYVMIRAVSAARLKVIILCPSGVKYTYNLRGDNTWEAYLFSDGDGEYKVNVYREVTSGKYAAIASVSLHATLKDPNAPFLHPNQYVNFTEDSVAVRHVAKICTEKMKDIERIEAIYHYVITNISYDHQKAASVKSGYIPDVDKVFQEKKGICFDYAALMTAMLRAYGIPTKLVVGYTGDEYHAWISTFTQESGWVEGAIFFNGTDWKLMDPTFASSANSSKEIMEYIAKTSNYTAKYIY